MSLDFSKLSDVTVTTQEEMDMIPEDFKGRIYIKSELCISVNKRYYCSVVAHGNSSVVAHGNSSVVAWENSFVEAHENSSVVAWENSFVETHENSSVKAYGNSSVKAWENSSVKAYGNSSVVAYGNSSVVAWENSFVEAWGNSQIVDRQLNGDIQVSGNARIVYMPKNIHEIMNFYGIKHTKTKAIFYKAVHKMENGRLVSHYNNNFEYKIGDNKTEVCDNDTSCECSRGIHISHLDWALSFGSSWPDLAIIECETKIDDIVVPNNTDGKVRTSKIKVVREVPLEECGVYGKILAKRRKE